MVCFLALLTIVGIDASSKLFYKQFIWEIIMWRFLDHISYPILISIAAFMLLAPFSPMPHVAEKLIMLKEGNLTRPVDIFDLFFHLVPSLLLAIKFLRRLNRR
jgi:hypothetical protein